VTRAQADADAARRNASSQDEGLWAAQRTGEDDWRVVHLVATGLHSTKPTGAHVESRPKPPEQPDPRSAFAQNVPPYGTA